MAIVVVSWSGCAHLDHFRSRCERLYSHLVQTPRRKKIVGIRSHDARAGYGGRCTCPPATTAIYTTADVVLVAACAVRRIRRYMYNPALPSTAHPRTDHPHERRACSCAATRSLICWASAASFGDSWLRAAAMIPGTTPASETAAEKPG